MANKPGYTDASLNFAALLKRFDFKWEVKGSLVNLKYLRAELTKHKQALNSVHSLKFHEK